MLPILLTILLTPPKHAHRAQPTNMYILGQGPVRLRKLVLEFLVKNHIDPAFSPGNKFSVSVRGQDVKKAASLLKQAHFKGFIPCIPPRQIFADPGSF